GVRIPPSARLRGSHIQAAAGMRACADGRVGKRPALPSQLEEDRGQRRAPRFSLRNGKPGFLKKLGFRKCTGLMSGPSPSVGWPRQVRVLTAEVLRYLAPARGQIIVDATVGAGGHARLIAPQIGPTGRIVGLDRDPAMLELARSQLQGLPVQLWNANFDQLQ